MTANAMINAFISSQSWLEFLEGSLLVQMKQMLRMGDVQSACCIHNRHMVRREGGRAGGREEEEEWEREEGEVDHQGVVCPGQLMNSPFCRVI